MKNYGWLLFFWVLGGSCEQNSDVPLSVLNTDIDCRLIRLEQKVFNGNVKMIKEKMDSLTQLYPNFMSVYVYNIIGIEPDNEVAGMTDFINAYSDIYPEVNKKFNNFSSYYQEIKDGLKRLHYYIPTYNLPKHIYTYIAPFHSFSAFICDDGLGLGLQLYMGSDYIYYNSELLKNIFPEYLIKKFSQEYIVFNALKNIVDDCCPLNPSSNTLLDQMIDAGKQVYLIKKLAPKMADTILFGFSENHLKTTQKNIKEVWGFIIKNKYLYTREPLIIRDFIGDGPYCTSLNKSFPANLGSYLGYQMVDMWMKKTNQTIPQLIKINNQNIFNESEYRP